MEESTVVSMYISCKEKWSKISTEKHTTSEPARNTTTTRLKKHREMKREMNDVITV